MRLWRESRAARGGLRLPRNADRPVALPEAGPLTLSGVEGSSGGGPPFFFPFQCPARNLRWGIWARLALLNIQKIHNTHSSRGEAESAHPDQVRRACPLPPSPPLSTKTRGIGMYAAHAYASVFFSPSPLKALREMGIKGVRVPSPRAESTHPEATRRACPESLEWVERWWPEHRQPAITFPPTPYPSFPPLSTKTRGRRMCSAHTSASVFFSPSPLKILRERGTKGERVPCPMAEPTHPEATRRACPESLEWIERRWPMNCQPDAPFPPTLHQSFSTPTCPLPSSPPSSNELEAEVGALAPTSASVLLSPSPLKALRERGTKGERVPRPMAESTHPEQGRRVDRILGGPPCRTDYAVTPMKA